MADNFPLTPGSGRNAATDQVTYSGDTADVQIVRIAQITGSEGSKTVVDLPGDAANGLDVDVTRVSGDVTIVQGTAANLNMTEANSGAIKTATELLDDAVHTDDATRGKSLLVGAVFDDSSPVAITENQAGYLRMSSRRALMVEGVSGGTAFSAFCTVAGDITHDVANSIKVPVLTGAEAIAHGTNPTAVAAGDRTLFYANRAGVPFVIGGHPNIVTTRLQFTAAQTDTAIVTISTGLKIVVTQLQVTLDNASTVFPLVRIGFGSTNTPTAAGTLAAHGGVPAGGGFSRGDGSGMLGVGGDGEDLRITTVGAATGNGVEVIVSYFTIES
jgi:hypothetical protein